MDSRNGIDEGARMTNASNSAGAAIAFVLFGVLCISFNDMLIKQLSNGYPLHQIVFFRSFIAVLITLVFLQFEGGFAALHTERPWLHVLRGILIVISNMAFFLALAVLPLADVTALFFVAPLFITLLSIPLLGEKVGPLRLGAVVVGFVGVVIMQRPWEGDDTLTVSRIVLLLPVLAAFTYALNQLMTRKLGVKAPASTLAILKQEGWRLVVCTNKIEGSARKVLREFQLLDFFEDVVGPDTYGVSKPNPEHLQKCVSDKWASLPTIMVGDSEVDCAAAKAAGFPMALVDWGYNKGRLSELEPNFVLSDIREIHQILDKISSN